MPRYRKKPIEIEARLYDPDAPNAAEVLAWCGAHEVWLTVGRDDYGDPIREQALAIHTLEGELILAPGSYVICGVAGEFYACKPDIFAATYDEVPA